ncbi:MAG: hypothetical protein KC486_13405 [Myxococcales bacterium]|nr:hypothetical protein [Myxococcales bacterium]
MVALAIAAAPMTAGAASAAPQGRAADVPLAIEPPAAQDTPATATSDADNGGADEGADTASDVGDPSGEGAGEIDARPVPAPRMDPREVPLRVAVGLGPNAPGSKDERALVDALERASAASTWPRAEVRRLRAGAETLRGVCRERRDDLVIFIDYVPERADPVVVAFDCALDSPLATRAADAAAEPGLVGALWEEHDALLRAGAQERRPPLMSRRTRRVLIAGGAIAVLGVALGLILASTLRPSTVVLTVGP